MWPTTLEQPHFVSCAAATLMSLSLSLSLSLSCSSPHTPFPNSLALLDSLSLFVRLSHTFSLLSVSAHPDLSNINDDDDNENAVRDEFCCCLRRCKVKSLPLGKSFNLGNGSTAELIDGSRIRIDIVLINVSINWVNLVSRAYVCRVI